MHARPSVSVVTTRQPVTMPALRIAGHGRSIRAGNESGSRDAADVRNCTSGSPNRKVRQEPRPFVMEPSHLKPISSAAGFFARPTMTKRIALLTVATNFIGYFVTECACVYLRHKFPLLAVLFGGSLCAIVNTAIGLACADILTTVALCWVAFPTCAGAGIAAYFSGNSLAIFFGAMVGLGSTPLFLPKSARPLAG